MSGGEDGRAGGAGSVGVVVTRDEGSDGPLTTLLADRGLRVHHWPTIRFAPPEDRTPLDSALAELESFEWVVFSSPRAVEALADDDRLPLRPASLKVAAVGESTAAAAADAGWAVDLVPAEYTGEALVTALTEAGVGEGTRVFFPASEIARDVVPDGLAARGAEVVRVVAYRPVTPPLDAAACRQALESGAVGMITFTSPSTVQNLQAELGPELFDLAVRSTRAVAIGPTTGAAVRQAGWPEVAEADSHTLDGLADRAAEVAGRNSIQEA